MDKDERNRVMDRLLKALNGIDLRDLTYLTSPTDVEAIRECNKLARAWDILSKEVDDNLAGYGGTRKKMDRILSDLTPTPKDPLEELEEWVKGEWRDKRPPIPQPVWVNLDSLLAEIRRLRGMK